jgi:hypothetical protein
MLETRSSPVSDFATTSAAVFPSEPGAPFGHSGISFGVSAAEAATASNDTRRTDIAVLMVPLQTRADRHSQDLIEGGHAFSPVQALGERLPVEAGSRRESRS